MLKAKGYTGDRVRPVVVAKAALPAGQPVTPDDLEIKSWPEASVPSGAYEIVEQLFVGGKQPVPAVGILAGEPVVASRLSSTETGTGVQRLVRPNMRAVALRVDDAVGYTGLIYPGAYVDVIVTVRDPEGRGPSSRIGVQHARVLTVGADTDVVTRKKRSEQTADRLTGVSAQGGTYVTLEVTPHEAEVLSIARNEGKIDLALRNGTDDATVETYGAFPTQFSAFAQELVAAQSSVGGGNVDGGRTLTAAARSGRSDSRSSSRSSSSKGSIRIMAHDEREEPRRAAPAQIETYHAQ
jgi:pilus assembly protein CpaB